jgi:hypothetical protein
MGQAAQSADFLRRGVEQSGTHCFHVLDANGFRLVSVHCRDNLQELSFAQNHLTSDEARRIAKAIARLPELFENRTGICSEEH